MTLVHSADQEIGSIPTEQAPPSVADVLDIAAALIEPEGRWTQNTYGTPDEGKGYVCLCLYGAICEAARPIYEAAHPDAYDDFEDDAYKAVIAVVGDNPIQWNDAPERTQAEVVAALRAAAEKARTASSVGIAAGDEPKTSAVSS